LSYQPELKRDMFFWPGLVFHDRSYLWVGEFKSPLRHAASRWIDLRVGPSGCPAKTCVGDTLPEAQGSLRRVMGVFDPPLGGYADALDR